MLGIQRHQSKQKIILAPVFTSTYSEVRQSEFRGKYVHEGTNDTGLSGCITIVYWFPRVKTRFLDIHVIVRKEFTL